MNNTDTSIRILYEPFFIYLFLCVCCCFSTRNQPLKIRQDNSNFLFVLFFYVFFVCLFLLFFLTPITFTKLTESAFLQLGPAASKPSTEQLSSIQKLKSSLPQLRCRYSRHFLSLINCTYTFIACRLQLCTHWSVGTVGRIVCNG